MRRIVAHDVALPGRAATRVVESAPERRDRRRTSGMLT
jgi:hypothetical protein